MPSLQGRALEEARNFGGKNSKMYFVEESLHRKKMEFEQGRLGRATLAVGCHFRPILAFNTVGF